VISNVALMAGSSQQGNAFLAETASNCVTAIYLQHQHQQSEPACISILRLQVPFHLHAVGIGVKILGKIESVHVLGEIGAKVEYEECCVGSRDGLTKI